MLEARRLAALALLMPACSAPPAADEVDASSSTAADSATLASTEDGSSGANHADDTSGGLSGFTTEPPDSDSGEGGSNVPTPESIDYTFCELDAPPTASVVGMTPEGPFEGLYAWFGWLTCNGEGVSPTLVLVEDPADLAAAVMVSPSGDAVPTPSLEWSLLGACSPNAGWVGEGATFFYARTNEPWHSAVGTIAIHETHRIFDAQDPDDPPRIHGALTVQGTEGWELSGEFTAHYCGPLSYPLGCE
jgi:hypothetical protein